MYHRLHIHSSMHTSQIAYDFTDYDFIHTPSFHIPAQRDVKRMLAYSSIAHAGFPLTGVIALNKAGLDASIFYLLPTASLLLEPRHSNSGSRFVRGSHRSSPMGLALQRSPFAATLFCHILAGFLQVFHLLDLSESSLIFSAAYESGNRAVVIVGVLARLPHTSISGLLS